MKRAGWHSVLVLTLAGSVIAGCSGGSTGRGGAAATTAAGVTSGSSSTGSGTGTATTTSSATWVPAGVNVQPGPLFDIPQGYLANGGDPVFVPARYESDSFTDRPPGSIPGPLRIVSWNIHRGEDALAVLDAC